MFGERLEYRTTKQRTAERYFRCTRCGARGEVVFEAKGDSGWVREDRGDSFSAAHHAGVSAEADLVADEERTLGLIRCPLCGERDRATVRWAAIRVGAWMSIGAASTAIGGLAVIYGPVLFGALAVGQAWREYGRFRRAGRAIVTKLERPKPEPRAASPKLARAKAPHRPAPARSRPPTIEAPPVAPPAGAPPRSEGGEPLLLREPERE